MRCWLFIVLWCCGAAQAQVDPQRVVARLEAAADGCTDARPGRRDRALPPQRFFVIAHELGHFVGRHHARFVERTAALLASGTAEAAVPPALGPLSRHNELEADAFAAELMRRTGLDPEAGARFLDAAGGSGSATHPSPAARARAIRETAAAFASAF